MNEEGWTKRDFHPIYTINKLLRWADPHFRLRLIRGYRQRWARYYYKGFFCTVKTIPRNSAVFWRTEILLTASALERFCQSKPSNFAPQAAQSPHLLPTKCSSCFQLPVLAPALPLPASLNMMVRDGLPNTLDILSHVLSSEGLNLSLFNTYMLPLATSCRIPFEGHHVVWLWEISIRSWHGVL